MNESKPYIFNQIEGSSTANILINGEISDYWGVGLRDMAKDIANANADNIMIQINSVGGSVFEGQAIASFIEGFPAEINTSILGICASIATMIAISGKETSISKGSLFMIHNASSFTWGDAENLRDTADLLDKIDGQLTEKYLDVIEANGKLINGSREETKEKVSMWQNEETWFTAEEAVDNGFIQKLTNGVEFVNKVNAKDIYNTCSKYKNIPTAFLNKVKTIADMADETKTENNPNEKGFFDLIKNYFSKDSVSEKDTPEELTKDQKIEAAKKLLAEENLLGNEKVDTSELEEELANAKREKEEAEAKANKLEEEKNSASAVGPKDIGISDTTKELNDEQIINKLLAPHKETLDAMAKSIFK